MSPYIIAYLFKIRLKFRHGQNLVQVIPVPFVHEFYFVTFYAARIIKADFAPDQSVNFGIQKAQLLLIAGAVWQSVIWGLVYPFVREVEAVANGQYFDLQGRKVQNPVKGQIYILNGKKVLF